MPTRVTRSLTRRSLGDTNGNDTGAVNGDRTRGRKRIAPDEEQEEEREEEQEEGQTPQGCRKPKRVKESRRDGTNGGRTSQGRGRASVAKHGQTAGQETRDKEADNLTEPAAVSVKTRVKQETEEDRTEEEEEEEEEQKTKRKKKRTTEQTSKKQTVEMKPLAPRTQGLRMFVGAHVSAAKGIHNAVTNSENIGGNAFALFLKSQRKWDNPPLQNDHRDQFRKHCTDYAYDASKHVLPHGSYLVNLAQEDPTKAKQAYSSFVDDLKRCEELGIKLYNFHPGATNQTTLDSSLTRLASSLTTALDATKTVIPVLETTCGHGTAIGGPLGHFSQLFSLIPPSYHARLGVCVDTCHSFAAGYDLRDPAGWNNFMAEFDERIGLRFLRALHVNDSKTPLGSRRDLHANIGTGFLGLRGFHNVMNDKRLEGLPMILETPIDRPVEMVKGNDDEKEEKPKKRGKTQKSASSKKNSAKPAMVEDKTVWAREIKLLESLVGMDVESDEFLALEEKLADEGKEEREKQQALFEKKKLKEQEKAAGTTKRGKKARRKVTEEVREDEESSV